MSTDAPLRLAFAGTPEFAAVALRALIDSRYEIPVVLTQPDRPAGRGRQLQASAVKQAAVAADIPVWQPEQLRGAEEQKQLDSYKVDAMIVVAYGLLLPEPILETPRLGCLNIHASLLPRWRGAAPIQRAIQAGDKQTGVCIMQMDKGLDTGDVLVRRELAIDDNATAGVLHDQLASLGATALLDCLDKLSAGAAIPTPQPEQGACYAHKLKKSEALLDFHQSAETLHRQIMAFNPWPVAQTTLDGQQLRVWRSELVAGVTAANDISPGTVTQITSDGILVATGDGLIKLTELQRAGKKAGAASELARGMQLEGQVLG